MHFNIYLLVSQGLAMYLKWVFSVTTITFPGKRHKVSEVITPVTSTRGMQYFISDSIYCSTVEQSLPNF